MEKLVSEIVSVEIDIRYEGTEWETEDRRGYRVFESHPLAEIKEEEPCDLRLFLGSYEVKDYRDIWNDFHCKIPIWYCVRTWENDYYRFVCGLDLMSDGRVWVGVGKDSYFDSVDEAMNFVQKHEGKECVIFTEEKMLL
jgi:hypothetical protein